MIDTTTAKGTRDAEAIFRAGLDRADPFRMMLNSLSLSGDILSVRTESAFIEYNLSHFDSVLALGMGKAGASMAVGLEAILGARLSSGTVVVKQGHTLALERITLLEAAHPVPDDSSVEAAQQILSLAGRLNERTLAIVLISGGGSALLCAPFEGNGYKITLGEKRLVTSMLLRSGADIHEINCVRKHLSSIKGGRLARALVPATVLTLILSDVVGDDLDAIASGPTVPDVTTWQDAMDVIKRYRLDGNLPPAVLALLSAGCAGAVSDTVKGDDPAFSKTHNVLIGTNYQSLLAAEAKAIALGYTPLVLTSHLTGEAREAALFFLGIGLDVIANGVPVRPPACIIAGGETTVTLRGKGKGGRNQEMALAFLNGLKKLGIANEGGLRLSFLSAGTDGTDGTTDVTGAFASSEILDQAAVLALDSEAFLSNNDSYGFFSRTGGFLATGPTNTNVCDIQILVIA